MRCRKCNYRLWNLRSRQCPECGRSFVPSDFEFPPNSVEFRCPHCDQAYYGTGPRGHLVPIAFDCGTCGRRVHMDEMVLRPASGLEEEQTQVDRAPWLVRGQIGVVRAWFSTLGMALVNPGRLVRALPGEVDAGEAWWFAVATNTLILLAGFAPFVLLIGLATGGPGIGACAGLGVGLLIGLVVFGLGTVFAIALWGAIAHGLLRATGTVDGPMERTNQALCYSVGANVLTAIPCLGGYIGWIWWLISATVMVKEGQRVQGWRAALAVLTAPVVLILGFVTLYAGFIFAALLQLGPFVPNRATLMAETQAMLAGVVAYAEDHDGSGPGHAALMVSGEYADALSFLSSESFTHPDEVPLVGITLAQFSSFSAERCGKLAQRAAGQLSEDVVAHRLGDFVFCHHGIDLRKGDPELWILILSFDPGATPPFAARRALVVGRLDGKVTVVSPDALADLLAEQNAIRGKVGLPPLPDPVTITHDRPATASP